MLNNQAHPHIFARFIRKTLGQYQCPSAQHLPNLSEAHHTVWFLQSPLSSQRSMSRLKLSMLFTSFIYALSQAVVCIRPPALLPTISDCTTIVEAIGWLSRMQGENTMRAWGRRLPTTPDTQKVPKVFWISGRGPTTCAVHVDVDAYVPWAVDDFRLSDVAAAGEQVLAECLMARSKIGLAYPAGMDGHVYAKVIGSTKLTSCTFKKHYTIFLMIKNHSNPAADTDNACVDCEDRFAL